MLNPLLISTKENIGLMRKVCTELNSTKPRELIGSDFSLPRFIKSDLKNYMFQSHFVLDLAAFEDKPESLPSLIEGIGYQNDTAKIVIYTDRLHAGDNILDELVHKGYTNIIAPYDDVDEKTSISKMMDDFRACLSDEGLPQKTWRRFNKSFDMAAESKLLAELSEKEQNKPAFANANIKIAIIGAQSRIGTTTFAARLAAYFHSRNAEPLVVCANDRSVNQIEMISDMFEGSTSDSNTYIINGIDFIVPKNAPAKDYNAEIYDLGCTKISEIDFSGFDKVYLVGGTSWNELPMAYMAQQEMTGINYTVAVNFSSEEVVAKYKEALSVNLTDVICLPYDPDIFAVGAYEDLLDKEFDSYRDAAEEISEEVY